MHASSFENMQRCRELYGGQLAQNSASTTVIELGAADINGSYRSLFSEPTIRYIGVDLQAGANVDLVMDDPYHVPLPDGSADFVLSGQMLEHCEFFWLAFAEMVRLIKPGGFIFLIVPSAGPIHRFPVDCYRFYPDSLSALARSAHCHLVDSWHDDRGPWNDLVGVFSRTPQPSSSRSALVPFVNVDLRRAQSGGEYSNAPEVEVTRGAVPYLEVLSWIHAALDPDPYLEIGVRNARSLVLATRRAIGIDPVVSESLPARIQQFAKRSDDFFAEDAIAALPSPIDFAFIDGMHLFEYALRDFMNIERWSHSSTLVAIDDVYPNHQRQAARQRSTQVWTGDVWKLIVCLQKHRPDLTLLLLDTAPTGVLIIAGLNANDTTLRQRYNSIIRELGPVTELPVQILERSSAREPVQQRITSLAGALRAARGAEESVDDVRRRLLAWQAQETCAL